MNRNEARNILAQKSMVEMYKELEAKSLAKSSVGKKRGYTNADIATGVEQMFKEVATNKLLMSAALKLLGSEGKLKGLKMQELRSVCSEKYKLKMVKDDKGRVYMTRS